MNGLPISLPLIAGTPRRMSLHPIGNTLNGRGAHYLVIEVAPHELPAIEAWLARHQPAPEGEAA